MAESEQHHGVVSVSRDYNAKIGERTTREELDRTVLPQVLSNAFHSGGQAAAGAGVTHISTRYLAPFDELLVCVHTPTPLTREHTLEWSDFLIPNFTFAEWTNAPLAVQRTPAQLMWNFPRNFSVCLASCRSRLIVYCLFVHRESCLATVVCSIRWTAIASAQRRSHAADKRRSCCGSNRKAPFSRCPNPLPLLLRLMLIATPRQRLLTMMTRDCWQTSIRVCCLGFSYSVAHLRCSWSQIAECCLHIVPWLGLRTRC